MSLLQIIIHYFFIYADPTEGFGLVFKIDLDQNPGLTELVSEKGAAKQKFVVFKSQLNREHFDVRYCLSLRF